MMKNMTNVIYKKLLIVCTFKGDAYFANFSSLLVIDCTQKVPLFFFSRGSWNLYCTHSRIWMLGNLGATQKPEVIPNMIFFDDVQCFSLSRPWSYWGRICSRGTTILSLNIMFANSYRILSTQIWLQYAFPAENFRVRNFFTKGFRRLRNATKILKLLGFLSFIRKCVTFFWNSEFLTFKGHLTSSLVLFVSYHTVKCRL